MSEKKSTKQDSGLVVAGEKKVAEIKPVEFSAEALIELAIQKGADVGTLERLMAIRKEVLAEKAKNEFDLAMSDFQSECPTIKKTKEVKTKDGRSAYKYAPIESIVEQVGDLIKKHGFSYSAKMVKTENGVLMTLIVRHIGGHSEESSMEVPLGNKTAVMSDSQVVASASTFAKRYAFCNAFGILTGDEDNDGAVVEGQAVQTTQPVQQQTNGMFNQAIAMIKKATDYRALGELKNKIQGSVKYNVGQKQLLSNAIDERMSELLKPEAEKYEKQNAGQN
jgi:hypothetical protein